MDHPISPFGTAATSGFPRAPDPQRHPHCQFQKAKSKSINHPATSLSLSEPGILRSRWLLSRSPETKICGACTPDCRSTSPFEVVFLVLYHNHSSLASNLAATFGGISFSMPLPPISHISVAQPGKITPRLLTAQRAKSALAVYWFAWQAIFLPPFLRTTTKLFPRKILPAAGELGWFVCSIYF